MHYELCIKSKGGNITDLEKIEEGLSHIAFGSCADAVKLLLNSESLSDRKIRKLDLFNVSSLKRTGSCISEIKFFDRLKAFDRLLELDRAEQGGAEGFIEALSRSVTAENDEDEDEE